MALHNGTYYQQAQDNWKDYGKLYETVYTYPDFIAENGQLIDGVSVVLVDLTVENIDATNEFKTSRGEMEPRYGNPYLFKMNSILYLIDKEQLKLGATGTAASYFSEYGNRPEQPMAIELKPGESMVVQIGFLVGDRADGSLTNLSDLVISTDVSSMDNIWFNLGVEDPS